MGKTISGSSSSCFLPPLLLHCPQVPPILKPGGFLISLVQIDVQWASEQGHLLTGKRKFPCWLFEPFPNWWSSPLLWTPCSWLSSPSDHHHDHQHHHNHHLPNDYAQPRADHQDHQEVDNNHSCQWSDLHQNTPIQTIIMFSSIFRDLNADILAVKIIKHFTLAKLWRIKSIKCKSFKRLQ